MKLRLKRVNPLTLDPGEKVLMGAIQLTKGGSINTFPVKVYQVDEYGTEVPVEIDNDFDLEPEQSGNVRKVRPEV